MSGTDNLLRIKRCGKKCNPRFNNRQGCSMTRCTECDVILGRGQCVSCWKERDNPSPLNSKRAKKAPRPLDGHPLDGSTAQRFIDHATEMANKTMAKMRNAAMTNYPIANMPNGDKPAKFTKTGTNTKSAVPFIDPLTVPLQLGLTAEIKAVKGMGLGGGGERV